MIILKYYFYDKKKLHILFYMKYSTIVSIENILFSIIFIKERDLIKNTPNKNSHINYVYIFVIL
jgi:hypothetical protein